MLTSAKQSVLAELSSVSPETYTGVFAPGAELEAWAESGKIGARSKPLVIKVSLAPNLNPKAETLRCKPLGHQGLALVTPICSM